ncbi:MAG: hypothetical protein ACYC9X_01820 [Dehalococcoidia bacterium]
MASPMTAARSSELRLAPVTLEGTRVRLEPLGRAAIVDDDWPEVRRRLEALLAH